MHITGLFKLGSTLLELLQSRKRLHHTFIKCEKDKLKG